MNHQLYSLIRQHVHNHPAQPVFIFDYDGTLSDGTHRLHALPTENLHLTESWEEFNRLSAFDEPFECTIAVMNSLYNSGGFVIVLTGRSDSVVEESTQWLHDAGAKYHVMVMRGRDDNRKDTVIKEEFLRYIGIERITAAWDDSPKVIEHFRSLGITTYQVCDYGDKTHAHLQSHGVKNVGDECDHIWNRHNYGDKYYDCCISCGKSKGIK
jgi:hypothetical protein